MPLFGISRLIRREVMLQDLFAVLSLVVEGHVLMTGNWVSLTTVLVSLRPYTTAAGTESPVRSFRLMSWVSKAELQDSLLQHATSRFWGDH